MSEDLRWGIMGAAKIARTKLAPAIHAARGARLVALATGDEAKAAPFRAIAPQMRVLPDYDALLADDSIDAVYIPLPNHLHVEWTEKALAAGKHVLCEKPIALAAGEIDRLIAARDAQGRLAAEAFMICHHPVWARVRDLIGAGAIGRLAHVDGVFTYNNPDPNNIRNRPETGGGGLRDIGVYPCCATRLVTGAEPERLRADIRREGGVDTFARVWADFAEFTLSFSCGMRHALRQEMVFHGSEGWLRVTAPFNSGDYDDTRIELRQADGRMTVERVLADQYRAMIEAFGDSVRDGAPFACPLEFSRANQAMLDAITAADPPP